MITVTALDLVNEWIDLHRHDQITNFSTPLGRVGLRFINKAIDDVLNKREWDFAHRHDGVMYTHPYITENPNGNPLRVGTLVSEDGMVFGGDLLLEYTSSGAYDPGFNYEYDRDMPAPCPWVQVDGDSTLEKASYKIWQVLTLPGSFGSTVRIGNYYETSDPGKNWYGDSRSAMASDAMTYTLFAHEYMMPTNVRSVTSIRVQGKQIDVIPVSDEQLFPYLCPDPGSYISDSLIVAYAGGNTFRYSLPPEPPDPDPWSFITQRRLRLMLYPTPQEVYKIDFSYVYRFPQLAATTETLEITAEAASLLVDHAYAKSQITQVGNDPQMGKLGMQELRRDLHDALQADEPASRERYTVQPYGDGGGNVNPRARWRSQTITGL